MQTNLNRIPTVDDIIFYIQKMEDSIDLPVKDVTIKGILYQKKKVIVECSKRHASNPNEYVKIQGVDENGTSLEIDFPKVNDTPLKVMNRFYADEKDVNKAIADLAKEESKRCEEIANGIFAHIQTLEDCIRLHS